MGGIRSELGELTVYGVKGRWNIEYVQSSGAVLSALDVNCGTRCYSFDL